MKFIYLSLPVKLSNMKLYDFCHSIFSSLVNTDTVFANSPKQNAVNSMIPIEISPIGTINSLGIVILLFLCLRAHYTGKKLLKHIKPTGTLNCLEVAWNKMRKIIPFHTKGIANRHFQKVATLPINLPRNSTTNNPQIPEIKSCLVKEPFYSCEEQTQDKKELSCILLVMPDRKLENQLKEVLSAHFHTTILEDSKLIIQETKSNPHNIIFTDEIYSINIEKGTAEVDVPIVSIYKFKINLQLMITAKTAENKQSLLPSAPFIIPPAKKENKKDLIFINKINGLLEKNLTKENYTINQLCGELGLSRTSLYNRIKDMTGTSPKTYVLSFKMEKAKKLLASGQYNVTEIAFHLGYTDAKYFGKKFKKYYNMCPTQYRKEIMNE